MDGNGKPEIDGEPKCPKAKLSGTDGAARGETKIFLGLPRVVTEEDKVNGGSFHDNIDNEGQQNSKTIWLKKGKRTS